MRRRAPGYLLPAVVALAASGAAYLLVRRFGPEKPDSSSEGGETVDPGAPFEDVVLESTDGVALDARWVPAEGASGAAVLAPGRGGSKSSVYAVEAARAYLRAGLSVLMLSLRSQGASEGRFLSAGYREVRDIHGALDWLEERGIEAKNVLLHGFSTGGATVLRAAPGSGVGAVVEEGAYAYLPLLLGGKLPWHEGPSDLLSWLAYLTSKLLGVEFDPWELKPAESAARLYEEGIPLFIIQSPSAKLVPFEHAELIKAAHPGAELWATEGYEHVGSYKHPEYQRRLLGFVRETLGRSGRRA